MKKVPKLSKLKSWKVVWLLSCFNFLGKINNMSGLSMVHDVWQIWLVTILYKLLKHKLDTRQPWL